MSSEGSPTSIGSENPAWWGSDFSCGAALVLRDESEYWASICWWFNVGNSTLVVCPVGPGVGERDGIVSLLFLTDTKRDMFTRL